MESASIIRFDDRFVSNIGVETVVRGIDFIHKEISHNPHALDSMWHHRLQKHLLSVDLAAERMAQDFLQLSFHNQIEIRGEESSLDALSNQPLAALLDMLDGSDLLERDLGNWCSALTIFSPKRRRIISAVIGLPSRFVYFTYSSKKPCALVRIPSTHSGAAPETRQLKVSPNEVELKNASICYYGQKPRNFTSLLAIRGMSEALKEIQQEIASKKRSPDVPRFRIYNLAGNPMMMKLVEGKIDAVIELRGQKCHDVVPGFVIALRAGAVLKNLEDGTDITEDHLVSALNNPQSSFRYVLARNELLAKQLISNLSSEQKS